MTTTHASPRPFLGLRRSPGRLALRFMRLPLRAYRHDAGWLLGHTFVAFTHVGRRTSQPHDAVAMVLRYDEASREVVICSGWGPETDWFRNLRAGPAAKVQVGRETYVPQHRFLDDDEAVEVVAGFRRAHPVRAPFIARVLGWGDLHDDRVVRDFVQAHPFVAFRPVDT
jgi:deazaflavin-dependent oxidoreductase (nitroreductase family)